MSEQREQIAGCGTCHWFRPYQMSHGNVGTCHFAPPVVYPVTDGSGEYGSASPEVKSDDFCSRWAAVDTALRPDRQS